MARPYPNQFSGKRYRQSSRADVVTCENPTMADVHDPPMPSAPVQQILAAARFAAEKHASQRRKGVAGEPYVNHLIEVAQLIASSSDVLDPNLVMAGLLHDTIEDCGVTFQELEQQFGSDVASLVAEVTDDKSLPQATRKALQVQNAPKKSVRAQVIKLADKISNLRSMLDSPPADWSLERRRQYFEWAHQVVSGLRQPNRLLKAEFDDIYSKFEERLRPSG
jgi:(p)ppGpp synthase/HD superfamily hydrolase